ncbi:MAG: hypothetical protein GY798_10365 [Hyphomicrobiales bacterium]|nr:hypothetical protein [Hyphomicrobiales bacterium]
MLTPDSIPETIDDAELLGWEGLHVTCDCHISVMSWPLLRRVQGYQRLDDIKQRLRCKTCGAPNQVALYRRFLSHPRAVPEHRKQAI